MKVLAQRTESGAAVASPPRVDDIARLGPFEIVRTLARGGMSDIYLGRNVGGFDCPGMVALKVCRPSRGRGSKSEVRAAGILARLREEGRLGSVFRHPSIARVYGIMHDPVHSVHYLVQEYVEGTTLGSAMDLYRDYGMRIPYNVVLRIVISVLDALHYAHFDALRSDGRPLQVVHRDVKPENILLSAGGEAKLVDFGVARSSSPTRQITVGGVVIGTRYYMAPEQVFEPGQVNHRSDLYSVGLILYELCTLTPVFARSDSLRHFAEALINFRFEEIEHKIDEERYPGIKAVLRKVLERDPRQRYSTAGHMAYDLRVLLVQAPEHPTLAEFVKNLQSDLAEHQRRQAADDASLSRGGTGNLALVPPARRAPPRKSVSPFAPTCLEDLPHSGGRGPAHDVPVFRVAETVDEGAMSPAGAAGAEAPGCEKGQGGAAGGDTCGFDGGQGGAAGGGVAEETLSVDKTPALNERLGQPAPEEAPLYNRTSPLPNTVSHAGHAGITSIPAVLPKLAALSLFFATIFLGLFWILFQ